MARHRRWVITVASLLIVAPSLAAVVALVGRPWYPSNDFAIIDMRVRDVFTVHTPLTGLQSRPGWSHPAPLMFWAIAPLSWLAGGAAWMTRAGGALLQAIALTWLAVVAARRGLWWVLVFGTIASFTYLASNQWLFREPWNPHLPVPFFVLFLMLTTLAATGEMRQLIGMSVAAAFMVSTHISYALPVVACFAFVGVCLFVDLRRSGRAPERWRSTLLVSAVIWVIAWSAPLVDVALHWPGNFGKIARYFLGAHSTVGIANALRFAADEYRWVPPWLGGTHRVEPISGFAVPASLLWLLVPLALVAVGAIAVRATRNRRDARLLALSVVMLVVGVFAISSADEPRAYTFQWRAVLAAFLAVACGVSVVRLVMERVGGRVRWLRTVFVFSGLVAIAWGSIAMTVAVVRRSSWFLSSREREVRMVARIMDHRPPTRARAIRVRMVSGHSLFDGVVNELDRRGATVRVDPEFGRVFGVERVVPESAAIETWDVTEAGSKIPALLQQPGARLIFATTPLGTARDAELAALQVKVGRQLEAAGRSDLRSYLDSSFIGYYASGIAGIDGSDLRRLVALNRRVEQADACRCAVVDVPAAPKG